MKASDRNMIFEDVTFLYELSLSIGNTLDLEENCDSFLRKLMAGAKLDFANIWLRSETNENEYLRFVSAPITKPEIRQIQLEQAFIEKLHTTTPLLTQKPLENGRAPIEKGSYAYFALSNVGILELFSSHSAESLSIPKLGQLPDVIHKLGNTLDGCLAHKKATKEIIARKKAEDQRKSIALFPEENPLPILRISEEGTLLYFNHAAGQLLRSLQWHESNIIPEKLHNKIRHFITNNTSEFELELKNEYYAFQWIHIKQNRYYNIYGRNITQQKLANKSLQDSESKYRQLVEAASDFIYKIDLEGLVQYVNPTAVNVMKAKEQDIIGKRFTDFIREDYRQKVAAFYINQLQTKTPSTYLKFPAINTKGEEFWVGQTTQIILDGGKVLGFTSIARDISESVHTMEMLKRSEEKYRGIIQNMNLGLLEVDLEEKILFANDSFCKITGFTEEELIGKQASQLLLAGNAEAIQQITENNEKRLKGEKSVYETEIRKKNGEFLHMMVSGAPLYNESGNLSGSVGIHLDLTERKKGEEALKESENKIRSVINTSLDAIVSIDKLGVIREWNGHAATIFGYNADEAIGKTLTETIIPEKMRDAHKKGMRRFLSTGEGHVLNQRIELTALKKDGSEFPIEISIAPIKTKGEITFSAFIRDISVEKASQAEMEKALQKEKELNEMKSRFVSMTSHEFRTPLTTIQTNIEIIQFRLEKERLHNQEKYNKNINRVNDEIKNLTHLLNDILLLGKVESGNIPFNPIKTDLLKLIKDQVEQVFSCQKDGRKVKTIIQGKNTPVEVDENIFSHILTNLISNAFKYSQNGPAPEVYITFEKPEVLIHVKDFGIGIPEEELHKLFDSFFRASNVDNIQGTGLGLSIVKQFVDMHNGTIKAWNNDGTGSSFLVKMPYQQNF